jgi:ribosomal protein L16 Arg81 hydroxylase
MADALLHFIQHESGTIVLDRVQNYSLDVLEILGGLQAMFGVGVSANAYFTGENSQAYPIHWDTHDILVVQIDGQKEWTVFEPLIDMPLKDIHYCTKYDLTRLKFKFETTLSQGDLIYLPRGYPHVAKTRDSRSLHISFGLYALNWYKYLQSIVDRALTKCVSDVQYRRDCQSPFSQNGLEGPSDEVLEGFIFLLRAESRR